MTKRSFYILTMICLFLGVVFVYVDSNDREAGSSKEELLFADVDGASVGALKIRKGAQSVELRLSDANWVLPARFNYPADSSKVRSMLLKLLDLRVTQKITENAEKQDSLGVADSSVDKGSSSVSMERGFRLHLRTGSPPSGPNILQSSS